MNRRGRDILLVGVAVAVAALLGFFAARFTVASDGDIEDAALELVPDGWTVKEVIAHRPSVEFAWPIETRPGFEAIVEAQRPAGPIDEHLVAVRTNAAAEGWAEAATDERPGAILIDYDRGSFQAEVSVSKATDTGRFRVTNDRDTVRVRRFVGALIGAALGAVAATLVIRRNRPAAERGQ